MNHYELHQVFLQTQFLYPLIALIVAYALFEPVFEWLDNKEVKQNE